jgi:hypothetical protein
MLPELCMRQAIFRKPIRYRLRTLIAVMAVAALTAAAYGNRQRLLEREDAALDELAHKGGRVEVNRYEGTTVLFQEPKFPGCGWGVVRTLGPSGQSQTFGDADVALFESVRHLHRVDFRGTSVSPAAVAAFRRAHARCNVESDFD